MMHGAPVALALMLSLGVAPPASSSQRQKDRAITPASVDALERWIKAVNEHIPGQKDVSLQSISALTYDARVILNAGMDIFLRELTRPTMRLRESGVDRVTEIARLVRVEPGANAFLHRAAALHADAAMSAPASPLALVSSGSQSGGSSPNQGVMGNNGFLAPPDRKARQAESPLLYTGQMLAGKDGEALGVLPLDWNWVFARSLLDRVAPSPAADPFIGVWYHATAAFMFLNGLYAEARPHLEHAVAVLPADGRILFDAGGLNEVSGLPIVQQMGGRTDDVALRRRKPDEELDLTGPSNMSSVAMMWGIRPADEMNGQAERLFRRALLVDPSFAEAHVRLARLLTIRQRYDEAQAEAERALQENSDRTIAFYAHLFAGRAARARGQYAAAAAHYRDASALFPDAQSARLGASQLALLQSDVAAALVPIGRIAARSHVTDLDDPWWTYRWCAGRDADTLLESMWAQVRH